MLERTRSPAIQARGSPLRLFGSTSCLAVRDRPITAVLRAPTLAVFMGLGQQERGTQEGGTLAGDVAPTWTRHLVLPGIRAERVGADPTVTRTPSVRGGRVDRRSTQEFACRDALFRYTRVMLSASSQVLVVAWMS